MRRGFGILGLVLTLIVLVIVGAFAYNIGWSDGANTHLPAAGTAAANAPYWYGYGWHPFFGGFGALFGLFWFVLIVFGIVWLFRLAFFGRRMWGYGGGWYGHGHSHGMPPGVDERMQEWHRRAHGEQPPAQPGTTPPPPPDTRSV